MRHKLIETLFAIVVFAVVGCDSSGGSSSDASDDIGQTTTLPEGEELSTVPVRMEDSPIPGMRSVTSTLDDGSNLFLLTEEVYLGTMNITLIPAISDSYKAKALGEAFIYFELQSDSNNAVAFVETTKNIVSVSECNLSSNNAECAVIPVSAKRSGGIYFNVVSDFYYMIELNKK